MGKSSPYTVQLASLTEGRHDMDFHVASDFFSERDCSEVLAADVEVHLSIVKKHEAYLLALHCQGWVDVPCDRCLEPLRHDVDTDYEVTVKYGPEYDDSDDDVLVIPDSERCLDIAPLIYDTILLTIPLRHIHPAGECNPAMEGYLKEHVGHADDPDEDDSYDDSEPV